MWIADSIHLNNDVSNMYHILPLKLVVTCHESIRRNVEHGHILISHTNAKPRA
jgi:hypothetical protein